MSKDVCHRIRRIGRFVVTGAAMIAAASVANAASGEVNIYTFREPQLIEPLLKAFTERTGIKANTVFAKDGLVERMAAEGANSPADVLLTNEFGLLTLAKESGVTQPLGSGAVKQNIPPQYRDSEDHWVGLTSRARVVYASKARVPQDRITLEELADPKWRGKVCIRSGQHTYNTALFASLILHKGAQWTETWLKGLRDNLAQKPAGGDRDVARAIHAGRCDVGIANTYYLGALATSTTAEHKAWADSIKLIFPNAEDRGTHVNVTGAVMAKHAPNAANARMLIEFLTSGEAQGLYASVNHEYPVKDGVPPSPLVQSWGTLVPDKTAKLEDMARVRKQASELVDKVNFDAGPGS